MFRDGQVHHDELAYHGGQQRPSGVLQARSELFQLDAQVTSDGQLLFRDGQATVYDEAIHGE